MQGLRQHPLAHRHHRLDHPGHPGRGLGVADVGLDRAQLQRASRAPGRRWRAGRRPRSGRRGWCRCRGPRPRRRPAGVKPALARAWRITRSWEGPLGAVRPLEAPSWLTAEPRIVARTGWPFASASERRSRTRTPTPSAKPAPSAASAKDLQRPSGARPRWRENSVNDAGAARAPSPRRPGRGCTRPRAAPAPPGASPPARRSRRCRPSSPGPRGRARRRCGRRRRWPGCR